jgi:hypothetical protein
MVVVMVEPTSWLGSVSIREGSGEGGHRVRGPRPFALVVSLGSCTGVVHVRQCLCSFCVFHGCRSPKKTRSVSGGEVTSL